MASWLSQPRRFGAVGAMEASGGAGRVGHVLLWVVVVSGALVMLLLLHVAQERQAFELHQLRLESSRLATQQQALGLKVERVSAPGRLAVRAFSLGLRPASSIRLVDDKSGEVLRVVSVPESSRESLVLEPPPPAQAVVVAANEGLVRAAP